MEIDSGSHKKSHFQIITHWIMIAVVRALNKSQFGLIRNFQSTTVHKLPTSMPNKLYFGYNQRILRTRLEIKFRLD